MCSALGIHFFDYGQKASEDQIMNTWDKLLRHFVTIHWHESINELLNKKTVIIIKPESNKDALDEHKLATEIRDQSYQRLSEEIQARKEVFEDQVIVGEPTIAAKAKMSLAILNNKILEAGYKNKRILPIVLEGIPK